MLKKRTIHFIIWLITILVILLSVWSIVNFKFLQNYVSSQVETTGYVAIFIISFIFESIPSIIGPDAPLLTGLLIGLNLWIVLGILLISTTFSALLSYYFGHKSSKYIKFISEKKQWRKYEELFKKYGKAGMVIAALTPVPYIPALAGIFKMDFKYFLFVVTLLREIKYCIVAFFLYWAIGFL
jgi:membrane protein YqaA with SNARE-associated domain